METTVPAGFDYAGVSKYFAQHIPGGDTTLSVSLISGGKSNVTYTVSGGGRTWVLRRPPLGHLLPTAHDMAREYRVLTALRDTGVPVPRTIALCEDAEVTGAPFYVMDYVDGVILADSIPPGFAETEAERREIGLSLARTLAMLHAVDYNAVGLGDFGRPEGYLERQVRRWNEQWERTKTRPLPEIEDVMLRLRKAMPESPASTIVHGDYRLGNMILDRHEPSHILALLDWEMSTLGDPLSDLGYTLLYWVEATDDPTSTVGSVITKQPGFITRQEIIDAYAKASGRDVGSVDYYVVFAAYKLAIICEGIHYRYLNGQTVGQGFEGYGERCEALVRRALSVAEASSDPRLRSG